MYEEKSMSSLYLYPSGIKKHNMKEPLTFDDMILKLEERLQISDKETVINFLKIENYYRFSIYPKLLPKDNVNQYKFEDAYFLYELDLWIKEKMYTFIKLIELQIKNSLVNFFVHNHESKGSILYKSGEFYLESDVYFQKNQIIKMKNIFSSCVESSNSITIKHHKDNKDNCVPFWVLVEEMTLGQTDTFINSLENSQRKKWIDSLLKNNYNAVMPGWISNFRELRNKSFHFARLYGSSTTKPPKIKNEDQQIILKSVKLSRKEMNKNKSKLFGYLYTVSKLLVFQNEDIRKSWINFLEDFSEKISDSNLIDFKKLGLMDNWLQILKEVHQSTVDDLLE